MSLVYREGLYTTNGNTLGVGIGIGPGGLGPGIGGGSFSGVAQSELSKLAAPPAETFYVTNFFLFIAGAGGLYGLISGIYWWFILTGICVPLIFKAIKFDSEGHQAEMEKWEKMRMCTRCGRIYLPTSFVSAGAERIKL